MDFSIMPLTYEERKYTYAQSSQLEGQCGFIGHLRGDFGPSGNEFFTTWFDYNAALNTSGFKLELDEVINALRSSQYGLLTNRISMLNYGKNVPQSSFAGFYTTEYGFRVNTPLHSFLFRCNPQKGDYNFYCFCYLQTYLNNHMKAAQQDIRFIDSHYKELFHLPDGEQISVITPAGEATDYVCRYIDAAHFELSNRLFHICEFAEKMERLGNTYHPKKIPLPPYCFGLLPSTNEVIQVKRYESGYRPLKAKPLCDTPQHGVDLLNDSIGVSKAQAAALIFGSMFGWNCPGADPETYDEHGIPITK